jgi:hypothetical protein
MRYRHTQSGWIMVGTCGAILLFFACLPLPAHAPHQLLLLATTLPVAVVLMLFGALTVEVDDTTIRLRFGVGLIRKTFSLADVASCQPVRNPWWWGWGIRLIPAARPGDGRGWLYNVSGLDAVELVLKNGKQFRIGTDEPHVLKDFIQAKLNKLS